jgi:hypothetical protein
MLQKPSQELIPDALRDGKGHQISVTVDSELFHDATAMNFRRSWTDIETSPDLLGGIAL